MPLCTDCKADAESTPDPLPGTPKTLPPHGMDWGETCGRCDRTAEVTVRE